MKATNWGEYVSRLLVPGILSKTKLPSDKPFRDFEVRHMGANNTRSPIHFSQTIELLEELDDMKILCHWILHLLYHKNQPLMYVNIPYMDPMGFARFLLSNMFHKKSTKKSHHSWIGKCTSNMDPMGLVVQRLFFDLFIVTTSVVTFDMEFV